MAGLADAAQRYQALATELDKLPRQTAHKVGQAGKAQFLTFAAQKWGPDRRFSGSARSKKGKRIAGARYTVKDEGTRVEIQATGDPWYITLKGRKGGKVIRPKTSGKRKGQRHSLHTPQGPRATSKVGTIHPHPNLITPLIPKVEQAGVQASYKAWQDALGKAF